MVCPAGWGRRRRATARRLDPGCLVAAAHAFHDDVFPASLDAVVLRLDAVVEGKLPVRPPDDLVGRLLALQRAPDRVDRSGRRAEKDAAFVRRAICKRPVRLLTQHIWMMSTRSNWSSLPVNPCLPTRCRSCDDCERWSAGNSSVSDSLFAAAASSLPPRARPPPGARSTDAPPRLPRDRPVCRNTGVPLR